MGSLIKHTIRFFLFLLIQVLLLDKIHLHHLVTPYLYMLFILWLPFSITRGWLLLIAALLGFCVDSFRHHPGFHMAAAVLMAYFRPFLIRLFIAQEGTETNYAEPSIKSFGGILPYFIYCASLIFLHHTWLFLLEAWQFSNPIYFLLKTFFSTIISLLLIFLTETLFSRKQKFRTNTA